VKPWPIAMGGNAHCHQERKGQQESGHKYKRSVRAHNFRVIAAAVFTGARRGELRGMFWENYREGELLIARSIWNGITTDPKSRKSKAPIPIIPKLATKLRGASRTPRKTENRADLSQRGWQYDRSRQPAAQGHSAGA
jgi:hypothetical protein